MIKKNLFLFLLITSSIPAFAFQSIPDSILIGNVKVLVHASAKPILEKEWNMISSNRKYVAGLIAKMRLYFPVIEPILKQGNIPDEFKYLCVQESSLNPNAISTSQAVGYWQFKYETAKDVGMSVNKEVDERRHILESTKGAVNYFTRNNGVLNNWISTLLSYRMGLGALKKSPYYTKWQNKTEIEIDSSTDWYVLRFMAYKNFWESQVGCFSDSTAEKSDVSLVCYKNVQGKNLYDLSDELNISFDDLKKHNPWILKDYLPNDKMYTIYHPSNLSEFSSTSPTKAPKIEIKQEIIDESNLIASIDSTILYVPAQKEKALYPKKKYKEIMSKEIEIKIHKVVEGDNLTSLAIKYGMTLEAILTLNNLEMNSLLSLGQAIKYVRKIPMLELISKKIDEKNLRMAEKLPKKEVEETEKVMTNEAKEDYSYRNVRTKTEKEPLLIEPAISREINIQPENEKNGKWLDSQMPVKKLDSSIRKEVSVLPNKEEKTSSTIEPKSKIEYHTVKAGETLFRISKIHQISLDELKKWNSLGANQTIRVGQVLKLSPTAK
jgi:membrane-bound lytic murein transglycosylase D